MIRNPKMVYKVYTQQVHNDMREGTYITEVLQAIVTTPEEVLDAIKLDRWFKVKYVTDDNEKIDDYLR